MNGGIHIRSYDISGNQVSEAMANIGKAFRIISEKFIKKRNEEILQEAKEPTLTEKREQAKKQFHEFVRSH